MQEGMTVSVSELRGVTVIHVAGDVDIASAPNLRATIDRTLLAKPLAVILDLLDVDFLASVGLTILVESSDKIGVSFAVVASGPATSRPIQLTRIDELISLYDTLSEAVAALSTG